MGKNLVSFKDDVFNRFFGFDSLIDDLVHRPSILHEGYPKENIYMDKTEEGKSRYKIEIAVTGFNKDELEVERLDTKLVVRASRELKEEDTGKNYIRRNLAQRAFERIYHVSNDFNEINTWLENGILHIEMFKENKQPERHLLEIK